MTANLAASLLFAVATSASALPAVAAPTPFPDAGDPLTAVAYTDDLIEAEYENGKLPAEALLEIESSAGCLLEEEAAEAWHRLEQHAKLDGVEFTASWCYRNLKTQRRTYKRNCPWVTVVVDPPDDPVDPETCDLEDPGADEPGTSDPEGSDPEAAEPVTSDAPERVRVCRVPTARPGNSNHGWGRAIDITADGALLTCESEAFEWLSENAAEFGWVHPGWAACDADKEEAWHWEWGGTRAGEPTRSPLRHIAT